MLRSSKRVSQHIEATARSLIRGQPFLRDAKYACRMVPRRVMAALQCAAAETLRLIDGFETLDWRSVEARVLETLWQYNVRVWATWSSPHLARRVVALHVKYEVAWRNWHGIGSGSGPFPHFLPWHARCTLVITRRRAAE